jgi:hypothetical protein
VNNVILRTSHAVPLLQQLTNGRLEVLANHLLILRGLVDGQGSAFSENKASAYQSSQPITVLAIVLGAASSTG